MKLAAAKKIAPRARPERTDDDLSAQLARLSRQNAVLKREIARLQPYRALAYRDPLTGLWNRRYFEERLKEEISRSQRAGSGRKFSILVVDINDFKEVNDTHGHQAGDAFLQGVGTFLTHHLRTHDVPCRTGGDEFMVLLPDLSAEDCGRIVDRLRDKLEAANAERSIPVSLSLGTANWPESDASAERLIALADEAMYVDKRRQKAEKTAKAEKAEKAGRGAGASPAPRGAPPDLDRPVNAA